MTVAVWPTELPRPERAGWQAQAVDPRLKRKVDTGMPGYRRRWSNSPKDVALSMTVSRSQKAVFDTFLEYTIDLGTRPFHMPDPTTDGWPLFVDSGAPLTTSDGTPILLSARWLCILGDDMPRERIKGVRFQISFRVWVMP